MKSLITLCNDRHVRNLSTFCETAKNLDLSEICDLYKEARKNAPKRLLSNKSYFIESHNGIPGSGYNSNRREEHLAIALFNGSRSGMCYRLPDGRSLEIIDYQTPLQASNDDKKIGKLDLFGVIDQSRPSVIELKIEGRGKSRADTPLRALLEGLAYCAIVDANISAIAEEGAEKFGLPLLATIPILIILAPEEYWVWYLKRASAGIWLPEFTRIITGLRKQINLEIQLIGIKNMRFSMGCDGNPPSLTGDCGLLTIQQISEAI